MRKLIVGLSGASGVIYGLRLIDYLSTVGGCRVYTVVTKNAVRVAESECCSRDSFLSILRRRSEAVFMDDDIDAPLSSTSSIFDVDAMVVIPCSLKTLSSIANSYQDNLLVRAALNMLRLRKPLVLVVREAPLSSLDIRNMLKVSLAGGVIMPASPAFYSAPKSVKDLVDHVVGKVLDIIGIKNDLYVRWQGTQHSTQGRHLCAQFFGQECL